MDVIDGSPLLKDGGTDKIIVIPTQVRDQMPLPVLLADFFNTKKRGTRRWYYSD